MQWEIVGENICRVESHHIMLVMNYTQHSTLFTTQESKYSRRITSKKHIYNTRKALSTVCCHYLHTYVTHDEYRFKYLRISRPLANRLHRKIYDYLPGIFVNIVQHK